jgi:hypothetical protein
VSTKSDLGTPYLKPYFSAGYGMPHWLWVGVDLNAVLTMEMFQPYAGVRASSPLLDLSFGFREAWSFYRPFLTPARSYTHSAVSEAPGHKARYWAWEAEASGVVPLPHSALVLDAILIKLLDVPPASYVYDEPYRAIVANGAYAVLRFGAVARLLHEGALRIGVLSEFFVETGRDRGVIRVGPAASLQLTDHVEALGTVTMPIASSDTLGIALGTFGLAGLRYRWATGERDPKPPWAGPLIP